MRAVNRMMAATMVLVAPLALGAQIDLRNAWRDTSGQFARAAIAGAGFSFMYGDTMIGPEIPSDWQQTTVHDAKTGVTQAILRHGSGLVVTREMRVFPKFDAVEYTLRFKNTATRSLPAISTLRSIDLSFDKSVVNGNCVVSSGGGLATGTLPPKTFAIRKSCFSTATSSAGFYVDLATEDGRSSNKDLPFFFIDNPAKREGAFIAFGWSGQWRATVAHYPAAR